MRDNIPSKMLSCCLWLWAAVSVLGTPLPLQALSRTDVWSPEYVVDPVKPVAAMWTSTCDHRLATVCGIQNSLRVVSDALVSACPSITGPSATNETRVQTFEGITAGDHNLKLLSQPRLFGLFVIRDDGMVMADSLSPDAIGSNVVNELGIPNKEGTATESVVHSPNLMEDMKKGERHYYTRYTNRIYELGGGDSSCRNFSLPGKPTGKQVCPARTMMYARECNNTGDASGNFAPDGTLHRYWLAVEIGSEEMPHVPNENTHYNSFASVQNVRKIMGKCIQDMLLTSSQADWDRIIFEMTYKKPYRRPYHLDRGFYVYIYKYGFDSNGVDTRYVNVGHGALEHIVGFNISEHFANIGFGDNPARLEQGHNLDLQLGVGAGQGGSWVHYEWGPIGATYMKTALIVGISVNGINYYVGSGFTHKPKPFLENPGCVPCSGAFNSACTIENALSLAAHASAYMLVDEPTIQDYWNTLNSEPIYVVDWNAWSSYEIQEALNYDLEKQTAMNTSFTPMMSGLGRSGLLFPFIHDFDGNVVVNPSDPASVGSTVSTGKTSDGGNALALHEEMKAVAMAGGGWVRHKWKTPADAVEHDKMSYVMKIHKNDKDYYIGVGYSDIPAPLDTSCTAKFKDPCSDVNVNALAGAAMSSILASPNLPDLHARLNRITNPILMKDEDASGVSVFETGALLGYHIDVYHVVDDGEWECYDAAYVTAVNISGLTKSTLNDCVKDKTVEKDYEDLVSDTPAGGWVHRSFNKSTVTGLPVSKEDSEKFLGITEEHSDSALVKRVQHRFLDSIDELNFYLVITLKDALLSPSCSTDADCYLDQDFDSIYKIPNGTFDSDENNHHLKCDVATKRCGCAAVVQDGDEQKLYSAVFDAASCGDLPRNSIRCIPNQELLCPDKPANEALYLSQGLDKFGCALCPDGHYRQATLENGVRKCLRVEPGSTAVDGVQTKCPKGFFQSESGRTFCVPCAPGSYAEEEGMPICMQCPKGSFQPLSGQDSCQSCDSGTTSDFTSERGSSARSACSCHTGFMKDDRLPDETEHTCYKCPEGIDCPEGSSYSNFGLNCPAGTQKIGTKSSDEGAALTAAEVGKVVAVPMACFQISRGYWMEDFSFPFKTKSCHPLGAAAFATSTYLTPCVGGGNVANNACRAGHAGIVCGECMEGHFKDSDGLCQTCAGGDWFPFVFLFVVVCVCVVGSYFLVNGKNSARISHLISVGIGFGTFVATMQSIAAMSQLNLSWSSSSRGIWNVVAIFALDLRILKPDCVVGADPLTSYLFKICGVYFCVALLFGAGFVSRLIFQPTSRWYMVRNRVWNTFGTFYQALFVSVFLTVVSPFRCYGHPDGTSSMVDSPAILCQESAHNGLLGAAFFAMFTQTVPFMLMYLYMVRILPGLSLSDPEHGVKWKFILYRFHAGAWWYGIALLARNFLVALSTTWDPSQPFVQVIFLGMVLLVSLLVQVSVWPWKSQLLNVIDSTMTSLVICMLMAAISLSSSDGLANEADSATGSARSQVADNVVAFCFFACVFIIVSFVTFKGFSAVRSLKMSEEEQKTPRYLLKVRHQVARIRVIFEAYINLPEETRDKLIENFVAGISEVDENRVNRVFRMMAIDFMADRDDGVAKVFEDPELFYKAAAVKATKSGEDQRPSLVEGLDAEVLAQNVTSQQANPLVRLQDAINFFGTQRCRANPDMQEEIVRAQSSRSSLAQWV